jgi:hypothetical protein
MAPPGQRAVDLLAFNINPEGVPARDADSTMTGELTAWGCDLSDRVT